MPTKELLYVDIFQIVAVLLNFGILYFILRKFLYKPVKKILDAREAEVSKTYEDADFANKEARELKNEYENKMSKAKEEASTIINNATSKAQLRSDEIITEASNKAQNILIRANEQIESDKKKAINEIKNDITDIAIMAASKVVAKELSKNDHEKLIEDFIENAGDIKWQN